MYNYLQPVVAVVFSIIAGLGTMNFVTAGATLLIIAGVYIVNKE
jgi:drug/metabolite transporter (DMT)-like permease